MAWFKLGQQKESANEAIWHKCTKCNKPVFKEDWLKGAKVCPKCGFHDKMTAWERISITLDANSFEELDSTLSPADPLNFSDAKGPYKEKVAATIEKTVLNESVITGTGTINGIDVAIAVMDFRFLGGSLASGTGEKILLAAEHALRMKRPFILFSASGGARMHEGIVSLMQMAKTCAGVARLNKANIPYISVLTDPTFGGVSASYATVGDINIAEPGAMIGFAGRRVIEQTIKQKLPADFQTSEYLLEHGFLDSIVNRADMKDYLHKVLLYCSRKKA